MCLNAREITRAFCADEFDGFAREKKLDLTYVCFTQYDATIPHTIIAFKKVELHNTFGEYLAAHHMTQARIAETEKYAHVTFFFNGGVEQPNEGEDRILVKSPKVATYDLKPEMSAYEVCDRLCEAIRSENRTDHPVRIWVEIRISNGLHLFQKNLSYPDLVRMVEKLEGLC